MEWNKVWAFGRYNYVRFYPNPGFGLRFGKYRAAVSVHRGFEIFERNPRGDWKVRVRRLNRKLAVKNWRE